MIKAVPVPPLSQRNPYPRTKWSLYLDGDRGPPLGWQGVLLCSWTQALKAIDFIEETHGSYKEWRESRKRRASTDASGREDSSSP